MKLQSVASPISARTLAGALVAHAASLSLIGCISTRVVGEKDPEGTSSHVTEQTGDGTNCEFPEPSEAECASKDQLVGDEHSAWSCKPNELGALTGTEWVLVSGSWSSVSAYVGSALKLSFGVDGKSTFEVGASVAPVAETGHLCSDRANGKDYCSLGVKQEFPVGSVYPLHGITMESDGWTVSFRSGSYLEEWCGLQTPRAGESECSFSLTGNDGFRFGPACEAGEECTLTFDGPDGGLYGNNCSLGNINEGESVYHVVEEKDCGWLTLAGQRVACSCTSSYCYSATTSQDAEWRLTFGEDDNLLVLETAEEEQTFQRVP